MERDDMKCELIKRSNFTGLTAWLLIALTVLYTSSALAGETLLRVRANKEVRCGVTEQLLGFSFKDQSGRWRGFNVDFCRAVAVAALGDADKVTFTPLSAPSRFPVLLSGRIDLLAHIQHGRLGVRRALG